MVSQEVFRHLAAWTPFLLEGFAWNLLIAAIAAALGTGLGVALVVMRQAASRGVAASGHFLSLAANRVPTFALMFYCAVLLPNAFELPGSDQLIQFPNWIKAALALAASPAGFTAHNLDASLARWREHQHSAALLFIPAWGMNVLITVVASSAASLVGVNEVLSRTNRLIAATQNTDLMVPLYLYVSLFFVVVCALITLAMSALRRKLQRDATQA